MQDFSTNSATIPEDSVNYAQKLDAWQYFAEQFGTENMLPIAKPSEDVKSDLPAGVIGKVPSRYNQQGEIVGFHKWQEGRATAANLANWSKDSRYGFGIRLGYPLPAGGVAVCIDVDTENEDHQNTVERLITDAVGHRVAMRVRVNSSRRAYVLNVDAIEQITKRVFTLRKGDKAAGIKGEAVEILAYGQQFAAYGTHPSGADIEWMDSPAQSFTGESMMPDMQRDTLTAEAFDSLLTAINDALPVITMTERRARQRQGEAASANDDDVAIFLDDNGYTLSIGKEGERHIRSPFADEYSNEQDENDTSVTYFLPGTRDYVQGHFVSQHASDADRTNADFLDAIGFIVSQFEDLTEGETPEVAKAAASKGVPYLSGVQAGRELTEGERDRLRELNADYVHTTAGGKNVICKITKRNIAGNTVHELQYIRKPELVDRFSSTDPIQGYVTDSEGNKKRGTKLNLAAAWLAWPSHSQKFGGVDMYPNPKQCPKDTYNLYTGYSVEPKAGDVQPYLDLVDLISGHNKIHAAYVLDYLAHMIQKPEEKPSVAIVMRGGRGIGKGSFTKPISRILGMHYAQLTGAGQAAGRFNAVIVGKLCIFLDELRVTSRDAEDALKMLISESQISIERKGIDPEPFGNYARIIGASNHPDVIRTGENERRYLLLESSNERGQDQAYWAKYYGWLKNDGAAHLLAFLQARDISGFNPHQAPRTGALMAAMVEDLQPVNRFILEQLRRTAPFDCGIDDLASALSEPTDDPDQPLEGGDVRTEHAAEMLLVWLTENSPKRSGQPWNIDHARHGLRKVFNQVFKIKATGRKGKEHGRVYTVENFDTLREQFADFIGVEYGHAFNVDHD